MGHVELRLHPDDAGFPDGRPSGDARVRGWFRLRDDEPVDTLALSAPVDAFPPTVFNADLPVAWTPTVELTAHVRARPAPGWLACSFTTRFVTGGLPRGRRRGLGRDGHARRPVPPAGAGAPGLRRG